MAERELMDVSSDQPVRRAVPTWVWGCGCGCLFVVLALIVLTFWAVPKFQAAMGPDAAWAALEPIVPVDAPPAGFDAFLMDPEGIVGIFRREVPNEVPRFKVVILRRQADGLMLLWAIGEDHELPPGDEPEPLVLQGRAVDVRRIVPRDNDETMRRAGMARETPAWHIELGERRGQRLSLLIQSDRTAVDLDEIEEILAPFDVWATADELPPAATEPR